MYSELRAAVRSYGLLRDDVARAKNRLKALYRSRAMLARLTIARRIAAAVLAMWKHEEVYDPAKQQSHIIAQA